MKTVLAVAATLLSVVALPAQVFRPATVNGAVIGGLAGAVIGNNSGDLGHNAWKGAALGAAAGGLIGSAVDDANHGYRRSTPWSSSLHVSYGHGWGHRGRHHGHYRPSGFHYPHWGHYRPGYHHHHHFGPRTHIGVTYHYPSYRHSRRVVYSRPSYAQSGLWLGGITGAIIGHNSGSGNAWRGAAIGAGAGLLLGSLADHDAARDERVREETSFPTVAEESSSAPASRPAATGGTTQNANVINNYYGSSGGAMSSANSMFGR